MSFSIFTMLYTTTSTDFRNLFIIPKGNLLLIKQALSVLLSLQPLKPPRAVSLDLSILEITYKWNQTICGHLSQASFTQHNDVKVGPHCSMYHYFVPTYFFFK